VNGRPIVGNMGTLYQNKSLFETLLKVARDYKLPTRISKEWLADRNYLSSLLKPDDVLIDKVISIVPQVPADGWEKFYIEAIGGLQPGITEVIVHLAYNDKEMQAGRNSFRVATKRRVLQNPRVAKAPPWAEISERFQRFKIGAARIVKIQTEPIAAKGGARYALAPFPTGKFWNLSCDIVV